MELKIGESIKTNGVTIEAVHAYNKNKDFHPKGEGAGFILNFPTAKETIRIYVAGDTDLIDEMKNYNCDVAILPIGGTYTMNPDEAAQAVATIKPKVAIPYHYNYLDETKADPNHFSQMAQMLCPQTLVRILMP